MQPPQPTKRQLAAFEAYMKACRASTYAQMMVALYEMSINTYPDADRHAAHLVMAQTTDQADEAFKELLKACMPNVG